MRHPYSRRSQMLHQANLTQAHKRYRAEAAACDGEESWPELRWVNCEACGGTGEIIRGPSGEPWDEYSELCSACDGTGRDCVETQPANK